MQIEYSVGKSQSHIVWSNKMSLIMDRVNWILNQPKKTKNVVIITSPKDMQDTLKGLFCAKVETPTIGNHVKIGSINYWVKLANSDVPTFDFDFYVCTQDYDTHNPRALAKWNK